VTRRERERRLRYQIDLEKQLIKSAGRYQSNNRKLSFFSRKMARLRVCLSGVFHAFFPDPSPHDVFGEP
jgi:hypothetical protein